MDRGAWWATVHGVTESRTQLGTHTTLQLTSGQAEVAGKEAGPGRLGGWRECVQMGRAERSGGRQACWSLRSRPRGPGEPQGL